MQTRRFVIGDIHGGYRSLAQCLERSKFNRNKDLLISIGDIVDGYPEPPKCISTLLKIKNHIAILGNHDEWALAWMVWGSTPLSWKSQGGTQTMLSYGRVVPKSHVKYLINAKLFYVLDNKLFVHGGINWHIPVEENEKHEMLWDRNLISEACANPAKKFSIYDDIFIGHTSTWKFSAVPVKLGQNVWCIDQGGGYEGKLSIMDIDTKEYWQSDKVSTLYPGYDHRDFKTWNWK